MGFYKKRRPIANTVLVQDVSSSMTEPIQGLNGQMIPKIEALKEANRILLEHKVRTCPDDLVGCVVFSDKASVLFKLTNPVNPWVRQRIENMQVGGNTNMAAGLMLAIGMLRRRNPLYLRNIILLSDGIPNVGGDVSEIIRLAQVARRLYININTIGFGDNPSNFNETLLRRIAAATHNGRYAHARELQSLAEALIRFS